MDDGCCRTRYPILLIHGTGFRDGGRRSYWGRIPAALEARGARIFYGGQDGWGTVEENCRALADRVRVLLDETGCGKVHLIAHSKGGLEARCLTSSQELGKHVASVTMISTPNHGSKTMDALCRMPGWVFRLCGLFVNAGYRILGDAHPDFCGVCHQLTTAWVEAFNLSYPDVPGVLYRSYAGAMKSFLSDFFMFWQYSIISRVEGENDGLVTVESARWTNFRPVWRGPGIRGVSHMDEVDFRRRPLCAKAGREGVADIVNEYIKMVSELREMGL